MINNFYISLTGMSAFSNQISIASNNIANMETTGFKSSSVNFSDLLAASISRTTSDNSGCGVRIQSISENWTQGSIASASSETALAINGWGMFVVSDADTNSTYYTRDGNFQFNAQGELVYGDYSVMGYSLDEDGNRGALTKIAVSYENAAPNPTTSLSTTVNLNSGAEDGDTFETTSTMYDSLGNEIPLTITYTKSATANEWTWEATIPAEYGSVSSGGSGTLTFDSNGALTSGSDPVIDLTLTNGAASQSVTWDLYDDAGDSNGNLTQYAGDSVLTAQDNDGYSQGELTSVEIDSSGYVVCTYSNDTTRTLFQVALADFTNYNGLNKTDSNLYTATRSSGQAIMGTAGTGKMGTISPSSLEGSNVDLSTQMAQLITSQTAYQACSRSFSVTNEMMQVLVNMKQASDRHPEHRLLDPEKLRRIAMSTMSSIMNISLNGLLTYQSAISTTSLNIANVDTDGYSRQSVSIKENYRWGNLGGLVLSGSQWGGSARVCSQFVNTQLAKSQQDLGRYQTETTYLEYVEALFDESEGSGLSEAMAEFWNSWQELVNDPSGSAERSGVVSAAVNLAGLLNSTSASLSSLQQDLDQEIVADMDEINSLTQQIASINRDLTAAQSMGQSTSSLEDSLDSLNNELQYLANVNTYWNDSGQLCVQLTNGQPLVDGAKSWSLDTEVAPSTGWSTVVWVDSSGASHDTGGSITSGSLGACLAVRDDFVPDCLASLDTLAQTLMDQVNALLLSGYDLTGQPGVELFTGTGAGDLAVNQDLVDDPGLLAVAAAADSVPGDGSIAQAIAELQNTDLMDGGTSTCDEFYAALVSRVGSEVETVSAKYDQQSDLALFYANYRESVSGVSTDEETANLILYQQAYDASAKAMTVLQEMLETLINI